MRFELPIVPRHQGVTCSVGHRICTGGAFAWAAAKSGSSSGTAAKCKLYLKKVPTRTGPRCAPSACNPC